MREIARVTAGTELPVNVMSVAGLAGVQELARLDVRRLSAGSALSQAIWQQIAGLSARFLSEGDSALFVGDSMGYAKLQALFADAR